MTWDDAIRIALTAIGGVAGIGVIILGTIKFSADRIAEKLSAKYELKLSKELEAYKSNLDKMKYISKVRFDAEFAIYRELSLVFSEVVDFVHGIVPSGEAYYPQEEDKRQDYVKSMFVRFTKAHEKAQRTLYANAPFVSKDIYMKFDEILTLIRTQSEVFNEAYFQTTLSNAEGEVTDVDARRTDEIDEKFYSLMDDIRNYLATLEIKEDNQNG